MSRCWEVLRFLEEGATRLPSELASHVAACTSCQRLVAHWPQLAGAGAALQDLRAPAPLVEKLVAMPRLPLDCEQAVTTMGHVLDDQASEEAKNRLVAHWETCSTCRATWDALAALKAVGAEVRCPGFVLPQLAAVALPRVAPAARRARLAAAAVYILAGGLALFSGGREWFGRDLEQKFETAFFYGRAVVENRLRSVEKQANRFLQKTQRLAHESLGQAFAFFRQAFGPSEPNPQKEKNVLSPEEDGQS